MVQFDLKPVKVHPMAIQDRLKYEMKHLKFPGWPPEPIRFALKGVRTNLMNNGCDPKRNGRDPMNMRSDTYRMSSGLNRPAWIS